MWGGDVTNSRRKGAGFEREIARELYLLTGVKFERDLEQYRKSDRGDLITSEPWPFLVECKRRAKGCFDQNWWTQASIAASGRDRGGVKPSWPVVIYRFDRQPTRVRISQRAIVEILSRENWSATDEHHADITLEGLAYLYREWAALAPIK